MNVTILMPVYNAEKYIEKTIESILKQTYKDFEFLIIDDGSQDKSLVIINKFKDSRIKVLKNEINRGLIFSLNKGLNEAKGKYVVRIDSDDICVKERVEKQINYMEKNPTVALVGCNAKMFLSNYPCIKKKSNLPLDNKSIKCKLLFESALIHPGVVIRKEVLKKYQLKYSEEDQGIEDYGLWIKISKLKEYKIENLREVLLYYRIVETGITQKANRNIDVRILKLKKLYKEVLLNLETDFTEEEYNIHSEICLANIIQKAKYSIENKEKWLKKILEINNVKKIYESENLSEEMGMQYYKSCINFGTYSDYKNSIFFNKIGKTKFLLDKLKIKIRKKFEI